VGRRTRERINSVSSAGDKSGEVKQPVTIGSKNEVVCVCGANPCGDGCALVSSCLGISLPELCVSSWNFNLATGDGIVKEKHSDIRKFDFDRVDDLDAEHVVSKSERPQSGVPWSWVKKIGDDHDQTAPFCRSCHATEAG